MLIMSDVAAEKKDLTLVEKGVSVVEDESEIYIDPVAEKKVLRKIDTFLVPLLTLVWLFAYLDRSNIGNAAVAGMLPELGMSKQDLASMFSVSGRP